MRALAPLHRLHDARDPRHGQLRPDELGRSVRAVVPVAFVGAAPAAVETYVTRKAKGDTMGLKPEKWAELKALNRANKRRHPITSNGSDQRRAMMGQRSLFGTPSRSRRTMRKAREKGK